MTIHTHGCPSSTFVYIISLTHTQIEREDDDVLHHGPFARDGSVLQQGDGLNIERDKARDDSRP